MADVDRIIAPLVDAAAASLLTGTPRPVAVLLQGSCALGEASAFREANGAMSVLSDLDLAVVTRDALERDAWRRSTRDWAARMQALPGADAVLADWALGVYALDDLGRQAPKTGTVELAREAVVLGGDASVLARIGRADPAAISGEEVLRLLAVRATELLSARAAWDASRGDAAGRASVAGQEGVPPRDTAEGRAARRLAYAALKAIEDVGTTLLSATGRFVPGASRRDAVLEAAWREEPLESLAARDPWLPGLVAAAAHARRTGLSWPEVGHALGSGRAEVSELAPRLARTAERPIAAVAPWLVRRCASAGHEPPMTAGRHAAQSVPAERERTSTGAAVREALATARARGSMRTWLRLARHASDMPAKIEILRLAAWHRFGPPPWLVGAALAVVAVSGTDPAAELAEGGGAVRDALADGEAIVGRALASRGELAAAAHRTWLLLSA